MLIPFHIFKVGPSEVSPFEVGLAEVGPTELGPDEIGLRLPIKTASP